jgi:hypothetical protein
MTRIPIASIVRSGVLVLLEHEMGGKTLVWKEVTQPVCLTVCTRARAQIVYWLDNRLAWYTRSMIVFGHAIDI